MRSIPAALPSRLSNPRFERAFPNAVDAGGVALYEYPPESEALHSILPRLKSIP
jgi:hypothetical protein